MKLVGAGGQQVAHYLYNADGTTGASAKLVLPRNLSRSMLFFQNLHASATMYLEIGYGTATATLTSGAVSSIAVNNAGFNYTKPPLIRILGGGYAQGASGRAGGPNTSYLGLNQPGGPSPAKPAYAVATLSGGTISAITLTEGPNGEVVGGALYQIAPYVQIIGSDLDPYGCAVPSATSGIQLGAGQSLYWNGTACPTDPVAVYSSTSGANFTCRWMD
jgi:hypothetical protein